MSDWTQVKRRKRKTPASTAVSPVVSFASGVDRSASVESLSQGLTRQRQLWQHDTARSQVYKLLQHLRISEPPTIRTAVCLAAGSFSRDNLEQSRRSMAQLAVFLDTVTHITSHDNQEITMYAQDPAFTAVDKAFLRSLHIVVLEHELLEREIGPAFQQFGPTAFVADFFMEQGVEQTTSLLCSGTRLLLTGCIWHIDRYEASEEHQSEGKRLRASLDRTYNSYRFPPTDSDNSLAFEGLQFIGKILDEDSDS